MADTTALKYRIRAAIKANDNQEITGSILQQILLDVVDELNEGVEDEYIESYIKKILHSGFYIVDRYGNVAFKYDAADGLDAALVSEHLINIITENEKNRAEDVEDLIIKTLNSEKSRAKDAENALYEYIESYIKRIAHEGFFICDLKGNTAFRIDKNGCTEISDISVGDISVGYDIKYIKKNGFFICDSKGNLAFRIDKNGCTEISDISVGYDIKYIKKNGFFICDSKGNLAFIIDKNGVRINDVLGINLYGKTIALLGDSITALNPYPDNFRKLGKCTILNYGISGTHIAQRSSNTTNDFISRVPNIPTTVDAVVVMGGTNDFGHSKNSSFGTAFPFGDFTDGHNSNKFTFCAGVHNLFYALYERFTKIGIPVVIVLPLHHGNRVDTHEYDIASDGTITEITNDATGKTFREYVEMIERIAKYYSFNIIDAYGQSNINPCLDLTYSSDGLHLNDVGGKKLSMFVISELAKIFKMFNN